MRGIESRSVTRCQRCLRYRLRRRFRRNRQFSRWNTPKHRSQVADMKFLPKNRQIKRFRTIKYTTQGNEGLPKAIRGNANCVAVWKTGNIKELDLLATELSGQIPKKDILDAYEYTMNKEPGNRHNFLFIDLTPKKEHPSPFRFNYNEWILP